MKTSMRATKIKLLVLGLIFVTVMFGSERVKANNKPKVAKSVIVESLIQDNHVESISNNNLNQGIEAADIAADEQKMALVIENWLVDGLNWSSEEISEDKLKKSNCKVGHLSNRNIDPGYASGKEEQVMFFDVQKFISDSEF